MNPSKLHPITDRDRALLRFVFENTMATSPELKDRFFAGSEGAYRRIRYLINMGVLKVILIDANRNRVLGITPMGMSYVRQGAGAFEYPLTPRYYTSVDHDLMVLDLRSTFEKCKAITSFLPENLVAADLRKKYGRNARVDRDFKLPDAVVCFETTKKHYAAVELELTRKSKKRLERTFRLLMFSGDFTISLFVVKDMPLLKLLSGIYDKIWDQPWSHSGSIHCCYFVTLDEFRTKGPDAVLTGRDRTFTFRELEPQTVPPPVVTGQNVPDSLDTTKRVTAGNDGVAAKPLLVDSVFCR